MHRWITVSGIAAVAALALTAYGGGTAPAEPVTVTKTVPVNSTPNAADTLTWTMPDLIGHNLQDAQDEVQQLTGNAIFYTGSTDLTGKARNQIMDRNCQVCTSTPAPGATISKNTSIDFGVVRIDGESCP